MGESKEGRDQVLILAPPLGSIWPGPARFPLARLPARHRLADPFASPLLSSSLSTFLAFAVCLFVCVCVCLFIIVLKLVIVRAVALIRFVVLLSQLVPLIRCTSCLVKKGRPPRPSRSSFPLASCGRTAVVVSTCAAISHGTWSSPSARYQSGSSFSLDVVDTAFVEDSEWGRESLGTAGGFVSRRGGCRGLEVFPIANGRVINFFRPKNLLPIDEAFWEKKRFPVGF